MGLMDEAMRSDAEYTADTDQASESITYNVQGGSSSTVLAVVNRIDTQADLSADGVATREFEIWVPYGTNGLTSKPEAGDTVAIKDDYSDAGTETKSLDRILESDAAGWLCRFI